MRPELRRKAKLLRKLKPTDPVTYDLWWKLCLEIGEKEGLKRNLPEFMAVCGVQKENLFSLERYCS